MKRVTITPDYPVIRTQQGLAHGLDINGVITFRGIPYAKAARFELPKAPDAWEGVRDFYTYGDICQVTEMMKSTLYSHHRWWPMSEDCLNLNVWTGNTQGKVPVMVWFHGGGYFSGASIDEPIMDGASLASDGRAVVVSVNHRLGCLGYLDLEEFGFPGSTLAGLYDLIASLRWVKENIASFGGDPDNVTVFGQSGGGGKIMCLMQMPEADGLFQKAIIQSGVMKDQNMAKDAAEIGRRTVAELGLEKDRISIIQTLPFQTVADAVARAAESLGYMSRDIGPVPDGRRLLQDFSKAGFRKETAGIPVLVGSVTGELSLFSPAGLKKPEFSQADKERPLQEKIGILSRRFGPYAEDVARAMMETYPELDPLYAFSLDTMCRAGTLEYASARAAAAEAPVYNYLMTYVIPVLEGKLPWHGADLGFTFGNIELSDVLCAGGEEAYELQRIMRDSWLRFAETGNPGTGDLPEWRPFTENDSTCMLFDTTCSLRSGHDRKLLEIIGKAQPKKGNPWDQ
ncbi:MAG: carboxylesterase/lipase family protein [Oscillospiraceae bacterium]|nr:carboxylesterase/lipase family protein [Oscillospiraceae bacterium]